MGRGEINGALGLERPPFGQVARSVLGLRTEDLQQCLLEQQRGGGRLGEIMRARGLASRAQVAEICRAQARWVAETSRGDVAPARLPLPIFMSVCLPAYNEAANIEDTLDAACAILPEFLERFELVVVDDGSADGTGDTVARYAQHEPRVRLVRHEHNRGYGGAVTSGVRAARGDYVSFMDADGQFSLLDLPQLLARLDGNDLVIGYRYRRADPWPRRLNAWAWMRLVRLVLGVRVRDLDCAFKIFRRDVTDSLEMTSRGACINAQIMAQCVHRGLKMLETPVNHYPRYGGQSTGANLRVILRAFRELPELLKYRRAMQALDCGDKHCCAD